LLKKNTHTQNNTDNKSTKMKYKKTKFAVRFFDAQRPGRLTAPPRQKSSVTTAAQCASLCTKMTTCVSFSFNLYLRDCELFDLTEGECCCSE
jgi:hypothetical protein